MRIDKNIGTSVTVTDKHGNYVGNKFDHANNLQDVRYIAGSIIGNKKGLFEISVTQEGGYYKYFNIKN
jgi:hypothetical protein